MPYFPEKIIHRFLKNSFCYIVWKRLYTIWQRVFNFYYILRKRLYHIYEKWFFVLFSGKYYKRFIVKNIFLCHLFKNISYPVCQKILFVTFSGKYYTPFVKQKTVFDFFSWKYYSPFVQKILLVDMFFPENIIHQVSKHQHFCNIAH